MRTYPFSCSNFGHMSAFYGGDLICNMGGGYLFGVRYSNILQMFDHAGR